MPIWPKRKPRDGVDEYGRNPLWYAAANGDTQSVLREIDKGASVTKGDDAGFTPLHIAVQNGHIETIRALLEASADTKATDRHGNTPLWTAIMSAPLEKRATIARILLGAGADPYLKNVHGRSPYDMAFTIGHGLETLFAQDKPHNV